MDCVELYDLFWASLEKVYREDWGLFEPRTAPRQPEQALAFRLAHYLALKIEPATTDNPLSVDCEYRRAAPVAETSRATVKFDRVKGFDLASGFQATVPDVIVHRRRQNDADANLLVLECKAGKSHLERGEEPRAVDPHDHAKLMVFTGRVDVAQVEYVDRKFRIRDGAPLAVQATSQATSSRVSSYRYGASVFLAPTGARVVWYLGSNPMVSPVVEIAAADRDVGLRHERRVHELADW